MSSVSIGIIGAGRIGRLHAEQLSRNPAVRVAAVSDVRLTGELRDWANSLGIPRVTADYRELLDDPDIAAVLICSSTDTHAAIIVEGAARGKHMFCEKPVSFDYRETAKALEAVRRAGVILQTGFNRRFDRHFMRVRRWIDEGAVGEPHLIRITSRDPAPPSPEYIRVSGGLFMDMAIHDFDMARYLAGSEVAEVYAQGAVLVDPVIGELGDIDTAITTLRFENGALGVIDNSRRAVYGYDQRIEVFGSKGSASAGNDYPNNAELSTASAVSRDLPKYFFLERYAEAYADETRRFIECVRDGAKPPVDGNDALQAERIAHAAKLSLLERRPVALDEVR